MLPAGLAGLGKTKPGRLDINRYFEEGVDKPSLLPQAGSKRQEYHNDEEERDKGKEITAETKGKGVMT